MTEQRKLTREEIWRRIRETSREEFILSEMKRQGFWPSQSGKPTVAEAFIEERTQLEAKLREKARVLAQVQDPEQALKMLHKARMEAALTRREDVRQKRNRERFERATAWHEKQQKEITYVGEGIHAPLARKELNHSRLAAQSLPVIASSLELATAMGITINELRFLCYRRDISSVSHYVRFAIPKKSGGERLISAPMPRLKRAQYWILENILAKTEVTTNAHGFVKERNILSNAKPHVGKAVVVNLDLENFFPSVSYRRVKGIFKQLGYSEEVATLCALLCSEPKTDMYELDGTKYFVRTGEATMPQGAPTSPSLSNLLCRRLDKRLRAMAAKLGFEYTRYADDLTFSGNAADSVTIKRLLWRTKKIVSSEGLKVHPKKTQVMRKHRQQEVTGVVVNKTPSVCRKELKKFRALLFQIEKDGPDGKHWRGGSLFNSITGYSNFVYMIDPKKGEELKRRVTELKRKHKFKPERAALTPLSPELFRKAAAAGKAPRANWWQAGPKPLPVLELTQAQKDEIKRKEKEALKPPKPEAPKATRSSTQGSVRPQPTRQVQDDVSKIGNRLSIWFWISLIFFLIFLLRRL